MKSAVEWCNQLRVSSREFETQLGTEIGTVPGEGGSIPRSYGRGVAIAQACGSRVAAGLERNANAELHLPGGAVGVGARTRQDAIEARGAECRAVAADTGRG